MLISDPPEVTAVHKTVHASVGWGVNISCDVWSDPPSSLEWFRGTGSMEYLDQHTQFQQMVVIYLNRKNFHHSFISDSRWLPSVLSFAGSPTSDRYNKLFLFGEKQDWRGKSNNFAHWYYLKV